MSKQILTTKNITTVPIIPPRKNNYNLNDNKSNRNKQPINNNNSNEDNNRYINKKHNIITKPKSVQVNKNNNINTNLHSKPTIDNIIE